MPSKRVRLCIFCRRGGVTVTFDTGKELRHHVRDRHPQTHEQRQEDRARLRAFRKQVILDQQKFGVKLV